MNYSKFKLEFFVSEWKWIFISLIVGLIAGYGVYAVAPKYYEGSMVLSPATYGTVGADKAVVVESPQLTVQNVQSNTFLDQQLQQVCLGSIKAFVVPKIEYVKIIYKTREPQTLKLCLDSIYTKVDEYQSALAKPVVDNIQERSRTLTAQVSEEKSTIRSLERKLVNEKLSTASSLQTTLMLNILSIKSVDLKATEKHVEQLNTALLPQYTHGTKTVDMTLGDQQPSFPKKWIFILMTGAIFVGVSTAYRYFVFRKFS